VKPAALFPLLLSLALASLAHGLLAGSAALSPDAVLRALAGRDGGVAAAIVVEVRLPRVLAAFACGGLLALSGVLLQALLENPLAEPYVLGVSGGAACGALAVMRLGAGTVLVNLGALLGALADVALLLALNARARWNPYRLLLTGVVLAAGYGAAVTLLLALAPGDALRGMLFWLMGDVARATHPGLLWLLLAGLALAAQLLAPALDVLGCGEAKARSLGVAVRPLRLTLLLLAAAAAAAAVVEAGAIGFVGLLLPHLLRLVGVARHRVLLPASVLAGGAFLTVADTLARSVAAPQQLPVGALTALLGVPALLAVLRKNGHVAR
jgi:iron complex transport system permease protein